MEHIADGFYWLMGYDTKCATHWQTELQIAENAWAAFRNKKYVNLCIPAPHWYIGLLAERKVRSKATDLTVIPLIQWEHLSNGQWTDLSVVDVNIDSNIQYTFTLNLTINHGEMIIQ